MGKARESREKNDNWKSFFFVYHFKMKRTSGSANLVEWHADEYHEL